MRVFKGRIHNIDTILWLIYYKISHQLCKINVISLCHVPWQAHAVWGMAWFWRRDGRDTMMWPEKDHCLKCKTCWFSVTQQPFLTHCTLRQQITVICIVLYHSILHCTVCICIILSCILLYYTILCCIMLYYTVLYCTVSYCTVLYCIVLYCTIYCIIFKERSLCNVDSCRFGLLVIFLFVQNLCFNI